MGGTFGICNENRQISSNSKKIPLKHIFERNSRKQSNSLSPKQPKQQNQLPPNQSTCDQTNLSTQNQSSISSQSLSQTSFISLAPTQQLEIICQQIQSEDPSNPLIKAQSPIHLIPISLGAQKSYRLISLLNYFAPSRQDIFKLIHQNSLLQKLQENLLSTEKDLIY